MHVVYHSLSCFAIYFYLRIDGILPPFCSEFISSTLLIIQVHDSKTEGSRLIKGSLKEQRASSLAPHCLLVFFFCAGKEDKSRLGWTIWQPQSSRCSYTGWMGDNRST